MEEKHLTFDEVAENVKETVRSVAASFTQPDDDFIPIMEAFPQEGTSFVFGLDPQFFKDDTHKDFLSEKVMAPAIIGVGAKIVATVLSAWTIRFESDPRDEKGNIEGPPPSEHPDREEVVLITVMDSTRVKGFMARIIRHEDAPPTITDFEEWATDLTGRFVEPLQAALRDSSGKPSTDFLEKLEEIGAQEI